MGMNWIQVLLSFCGEATPESQVQGPAPTAAPAPGRSRMQPVRQEDEAFPLPSADFLTLGRYTSGRSGVRVKFRIFFMINRLTLP
jgi:hypothetical protein